jgi:hypothetical protein
MVHRAMSVARLSGAVLLWAAVSATAWFVLSAVALTATMLLPLPLLIVIGATTPAQWGRAASPALAVSEAVLVVAIFLGATAPAFEVSFAARRGMPVPLAVLLASVAIIALVLGMLFRDVSQDCRPILLGLVGPIVLGYIAGYIAAKPSRHGGG